MKYESNKDNQSWIIGAIHPEYGEVQGMAIFRGDEYRFLCKDNYVAMIPLSILGSENIENK